MPGFLLHLGASVSCVHGGQALPTTTNPRVTVMGQPVVMQPSPYSVVGCPFVTPGGTPMPCVTAQWITGSVRVLSNGVPLVLSDSQAVCAPNGTPLLITATQTRVTAI